MTVEPKPIDRLARIISDYDALICDLWGVLHNGIKAFQPAYKALINARRAGLTVILLTNAPRRSQEIKALLNRLAIPDDCYDDLLSSGILVRQAMAQAPQGAAFYLMGLERDRPLLDGFTQTQELDHAHAVIACGLPESAPLDPEAHDMLLEHMAACHLPLWCANPDRWVHVGNRLEPCAALLADRYETIGGSVHWFGKPHGATYDAAMERLAVLRGTPLDRSRILAIGDGLLTDVAGAQAVGIDCMLIRNGLHREEIENLGVQSALAAHGLSATYVMDRLQ